MAMKSLAFLAALLVTPAAESGSAKAEVALTPEQVRENADNELKAAAGNAGCGDFYDVRPPKLGCSHLLLRMTAAKMLTVLRQQSESARQRALAERAHETGVERQLNELADQTSSLRKSMPELMGLQAKAISASESMQLEIAALSTRVEELKRDPPPPPPKGDVSGATAAVQELIAEVTRQIRDASVSTAPSRQSFVPPGTQQRPSRQLDPTRNLHEYYPAATFSYVVVGVPDPWVPRHRRSYESSLAALMSGSLESGFDVARYHFPWQPYDAPANATRASVSGCATPQRENAMDDPASMGVVLSSRSHADSASLLEDCIGILTFRRDASRHESTILDDVQVRVVYLVPESATLGVPPHALQAIRWHVRQNVPNATPLQHAACGSGSVGTTVLGPAFSGAMQSWVTAAVHSAGMRTCPAPEVCLLSASATSPSNENIARASGVRYRSLAVSDVAKLDTVFKLLRPQRFTADEIVFAYEESTFGAGIRAIAETSCKSAGYLSDCDNLQFLPFTANVAELRARRAAAADVADETPWFLRRSRDVLRWDDAADNGSEYPTSRQSPVTAVGADLALTRQLRSLAQATLPRVVVIGATDIRDRLFLIDRIKREWPWVLLVDLEADILLSHPDYLGVTRGMYQLRSGTGAWKPCAGGRLNDGLQTDDQALLRCAAASLVLERASGCFPVNTRPEVVVVGRDMMATVHADQRGSYEGAVVFAEIRQYAHGLMAVIVAVALFAWWLLQRTEPANFVARGLVQDMPERLAITAAAALLFAAVTVGFAGQSFLGGLSSPARLFDLSVLIAIVVLVFMHAREVKRRWPGSASSSGFASIRAALLREDKASAVIGASLGFLAASMMIGGAALLHGATLPTAHAAPLASGVAAPMAWLLGVAALGINALAWASTVLEATRTRDEWSRWTAAMDATLAQVTGRGGVAGFVLRTALLLAAIALAATFPVHATAAGPALDTSTFLALAACGLLAIGFLVVAVRESEAVWRLIAIFDRHAVAVRGARDGWFRSPWATLGTHGVGFFATPMLASVADDGLPFSRVVPLRTDSVALRKQLARTLSRSMWTIRHLVTTAMLNCIGAALLVYAYPVPGRDALLLLAMLSMIAIAVFAAVVTIAFERDPVLSRLLCDHAAGVQWSFGLANLVVLPFVLFAIVMLIVEIPGMREWTGGYLGPLLRLLRIDLGS